MKTVTIYTDGACSGNQNETNSGGWGCILEYGDAEKELSGGERNTTNNRMELSALLAGLRALKRDGLTVEVFSDSSYLVNCFRQGWYLGWQRNGWRNSKKDPVENRDLWEAILEQCARQELRFYLVKGHVKRHTLTPEAQEKLYRSFLEKNGAQFSEAEFLHALEQNARADALAVAACPPMETPCA
jgi:ribonuclease HI